MKANHKVLFLTDSLSNGGAERQLALLIKYLPNGLTGTLWTSDDGVFLKIIRELGIPTFVNRRKFRYDITPFFRLWNLIQKEHPDIVHSNGWMGTFAAGLICKMLRIPLVDNAIRSGLKIPRACRIASRWADIVIANSQAGRTSSGIESNRVRVIYNGFDPERLKFCQHNHEDPSKRSIAVMTGRMVREKDFFSFLSVARALHTKNPDSWQLWAIGDGPDRENLISLSKDLINAGCLAFPEAGIEVLNYVRQATIGVLLTNTKYHAEGISNSIMEYMACGLPVICYKSGGNAELVIDGETGFLIDPGDTEKVIERLSYLHQNPEVAKRMGRCGREHLLNNFSVEKMVNQVTSIYQEILALR